MVPHVRGCATITFGEKEFGEEGEGLFWHGRQMYRRLSEEVHAAGLAAGGLDPQLVTEADLAGLPATVRRYMLAMGVRDRPRDWAFQASPHRTLPAEGAGFVDARRPEVEMRPGTPYR